jgi:hypothetical protein
VFSLKRYFKSRLRKAPGDARLLVLHDAPQLPNPLDGQDAGGYEDEEADENSQDGF